MKPVVPVTNRWQFKFVNCEPPDARFICNLSRMAPFGGPYGDNRSVTGPIPCDKDDAIEWKNYFKTFITRPKLIFALAIDFNQEPAQRAMEANRWKLVATGLRGHDRIINNTPVYARLYMKKFPKTGVAMPAVSTTGFICSYSCSFFVIDYASPSYAASTGPYLTSKNYGVSDTMVMHRIPADKLAAGFLPGDKLRFIAKTELASYYLQNAHEWFLEG